MQTTATAEGRSERFWVPGDWNAFFGFGTNILVNVLVLTGLLRFVLKMPDELVFGRILPATGLMLFLSTDVLRLACLSAGPEDRPHRCLRPAVGHQRAAHVRRHVRGHAADPAQDQRSRAGLGGGPHLGVRAEFRADGRRLHRAVDPKDHAAGGAARLARRHFHHLHFDAARTPGVRDASHRSRLLRHHPGQLVRRRTLLPGRSRRPDRDRGGHADRLGIEPLRSRLWRLERVLGRRRFFTLWLLVSHTGGRSRLFRLQVHRHHPCHGDTVRHL